MIKRFYIYLFISFTAFSCKKETPLVFTSKSMTEADIAICKDVSCPEVTVSYVALFGEPIVSDKINERITTFIIDALYIGDEEKSPTAISIADAINDFITTYRSHSAEFPDMGAEYFAEVTVSENYMSDTLISFQMNNYLYTGGAHGYGSIFFMNIDPLTGEEIPTDKLFKNIIDFTDFAERKFREANQIPQGESINATGFWFEEDVFSLPETIGFTSNTIILRYNQYDIAGYADGPIELEIPLPEVRLYLKLE